MSKLKIEKTKGRENMADSISVQKLGLRRKTIKLLEGFRPYNVRQPPGD
jgi:hypothetical protein